VAPTPGEHRPTAPLHVVEDRTPVRKLEFVEVGPTPAAPSRRPPAAEAEGTEEERLAVFRRVFIGLGERIRTFIPLALRSGTLSGT